MGEEILPFLDPLMGKLVGALQSSTRNLQETCMVRVDCICLEVQSTKLLSFTDLCLILLQSAIGSVASAAEQAFIPYAEKVLELMQIFMVLTNDEDLRSRARATELVGIVAMSVGRARMEPILPPFIEAAISVLNCCFDINEVISFWYIRLRGFIFQGFGLEFSELREYTHGFFSNVAELLDDGFTQA